jgi:hypothetical protein
MTANAIQIIVTASADRFHSAQGVSVYHRQFPEVRAEGESHEDAAARLAELLSGNLDSAPSDWRREILRCAIEDVRAFIELQCSAPS